MPYQQLRRYLQSPRRITLDPADRDCNPPEDPDWPTPTTYQETQELLIRLPLWARAVCALTAAEMVLPIWEEDDWVNTNLSEKQIEAPHRAIVTTWRWLDGEASDDELSAARTAATTAALTAWTAAAASGAADAASARGPAVAADAAAWAAARVAARVAARAARAAAASVPDAWGTAFAPAHKKFYREWWALCRCRLAFILEART